MTIRDFLLYIHVGTIDIQGYSNNVHDAFGSYLLEVVLMIKTLKLVKWGNSNAVRLPKEMLNQVGIASTDSEVSVETTANSIIIKPKKEKSTLEKMFENYDGKPYPFEIVDKGGAVGQELL